MAQNIINNVKMVFVMDKDNNIVERPATEVMISPGISQETKLSDEKLSDKMGIKVCIPSEVNNDFSLI